MKYIKIISRGGNRHLVYMYTSTYTIFLFLPLCSSENFRILLRFVAESIVVYLKGSQGQFKVCKLSFRGKLSSDSVVIVKLSLLEPTRCRRFLLLLLFLRLAFAFLAASLILPFYLSRSPPGRRDKLRVNALVYFAPVLISIQIIIYQALYVTPIITLYNIV